MNDSGDRYYSPLLRTLATALLIVASWLVVFLLAAFLIHGYV